MKLTKPPKKVSDRMRLVKRTGTKIEKKMATLLMQIKAGYEYQPKMEGHPDFLITGKNVLVFCDSSFWHGRRKEDLTGKSFKTNRAFWVKKLRENKRRDKRTNQRLRRKGYSVYRFWDTDIVRNEEKVIRKLKRALNGKFQ